MPDNLPRQNSDSTPSASEGLSMEKRMLIALILMGAVLVGSQYIFRAFNPPPAEQTPIVETAPSESAPAESAATPSATSSGETPALSAASPDDAVAVNVRAEQEETFTIDTDLATIKFSNRGAVVLSWTIKNHKDTKGQPQELVNQAAFAKIGKPFSVQVHGSKPPVNPNDSLFVATRSEDGKSIRFEYSENGWTVRKHFEFQADSYVATVHSEVLQGKTAVPHLLVWRGGFGDSNVHSRRDYQTAAFYDQPRGKLETRTADDAEDAPLSIPGSYAFAGIQDRYFTAMFLPQNAGTMEFTVFGDHVPYNGDEEELHYVGIAAGGSGVNDFRLFVGPKEIDTLKSVHGKLPDLVDFGWFFFIAEPLFYALNWLHDNYLHNYGWAIVLLTIGINFLMLPLKITSMKSMKKMQALQPQIQAINERYKGISLRDPRKQQQNQEVMELYSKNGVNPAAGCVPMLLQIPFFFAFYQVLSSAIELRDASWLWVSDLSRPEELAIRVLPLAMIVSQIFMQRLTPTPSSDPAQKMMMNIMPLVFGFIFWWQSSGLVLYWLTSNLVGIVQQLFINRFSNNTALVAVPVDKKQPKRIRK
jgi:YidC/Oxa1 family membrane protein insertase